MSERKARSCEGTLVRGVIGQNARWRGRRPAGSDAAHSGITRRPSLLLSLPVGMRKSLDGIDELQFIIVSQGV